MKTSDSSPELEPLLKADEVANFLGFSPITVRRMAHDGTLPSIAFPSGNGKFTHRFRASELTAYLTTLQAQQKQTSRETSGKDLGRC